MHEYIEIQFRRKNKPFLINRQVAGGFEFKEPDPPARSIDIGFSPFDDGTKYRMMHPAGQRAAAVGFRLRMSVEELAHSPRNDISRQGLASVPRRQREGQEEAAARRGQT
jgi:hypothetical protein